MDELQFDWCFEKIETCFGKYPKIKKQRIFQKVSTLSQKHFDEICLSFIDSDKKPNVTDFASKAKSYEGLCEFTVPDKAMCPDCFDTGFVFCEELDSNYSPILAVCECGIETNSKLAKFEKVKHLVKKIKFDIEFFKPAFGIQGLSKKVSEWKDLKSESLKFWEFQRREYANNAVNNDYDDA